MTKRGRPRHPDILTPREWEVLDLLRDGLSNDQIGRRLGITERTAKYHVSEILSKLGVANRSEAAAWQPDQGRPWWAPATAPIEFISRNTNVSGLSSVAAGSLLLVALGGLALLAFLLLRNGQGEGAPVVNNNGAEEHIMFSFRGNVYTVRPDGSDLQRIIGPDDAFYSAPEFSPDGRQIVFIADQRRVVVVAAADVENVMVDADLFVDETPPTPIASDWSMGPVAVHWSADGELLLVTRQRLGGSGASDVVVMNADGSDPRSIIQSGFFIEATWLETNGEPQITVGGYEDGTKSHFFDLEGRDIASGLGGEEPASAWLYWPEHNGAMVRPALGSPTPSGPIRVISQTSNQIVAEGCGATWSPDGERIAFYNGEGLVTAEADGDSDDTEMIVSNADWGWRNLRRCKAPRAYQSEAARV